MNVSAAVVGHLEPIPKFRLFHSSSKQHWSFIQCTGSHLDLTLLVINMIRIHYQSIYINIITYNMYLLLMVTDYPGNLLRVLSTISLTMAKMQQCHLTLLLDILSDTLAQDV